MRINSKLFFILFFVFGQNLLVLAGPPAPKPPTPPAVPIDQGILGLLIMGVFLGFYMVKKYSVTKKAST